MKLNPAKLLSFLKKAFLNGKIEIVSCAIKPTIVTARNSEGNVSVYYKVKNDFITEVENPFTFTFRMGREIAAFLNDDKFLKASLTEGTLVLHGVVNGIPHKIRIALCPESVRDEFIRDNEFMFQGMENAFAIEIDKEFIKI